MRLFFPFSHYLCVAQMCAETLFGQRACFAQVAGRAATDEGGNPYPEGSPYPGHEDFYDETSYDDYGYGDSPDGDDSSTTGEDSSSGGDEVSPEPPAEPAQPPPPTEEELRRVTITVSAAPGKGK